MPPQRAGSYERALMITISLLLIGFATYVDHFIAPEVSLLFIYLILVVLTANYVGGNFAYFYCFVAAFARMTSGDMQHLVNWPPGTKEFWLFINVTITALLITHLILRKNSLLYDLQQASLTDAITGIHNRRSFNLRLKSFIANCRRYGDYISVAYFDVDGFKNINDTQGHGRGDELLRCIGKVLTRNLREVDMAARLGGDEFAIIFSHTIGSRDLINRIKADLDKCVKDDGFPVTFSIGVISYYGEKEVSADELLNRADELMYKVKKSTKNNVRYECIDKPHGIPA